MILFRVLQQCSGRRPSRSPSPGHRRLAESLNPRSIEVIELNLEDAFIEYTRGPRRGLPIFLGESSDAQSAGAERVA
jgi:ABC-2 type transport system ATP-binding protein